MELVESDDGLLVQVCWRRNPAFEDTYEPLGQIYQNDPQLLLKLLCRKMCMVHWRSKRVVSSTFEEGGFNKAFPFYPDRFLAA